MFQKIDEFLPSPTRLSTYQDSSLLSHPLSVDPTFKFGKFEVMPFTYKHLCLKSKRTGLAPVASPLGFHVHWLVEWAVGETMSSLTIAPRKKFLVGAQNCKKGIYKCPVYSDHVICACFCYKFNVTCRFSAQTMYSQGSLWNWYGMPRERKVAGTKIPGDQFEPSLHKTCPNQQMNDHLLNTPQQQVSNSLLSRWWPKSKGVLTVPNWISQKAKDHTLRCGAATWGEVGVSRSQATRPQTAIHKVLLHKGLLYQDQDQIPMLWPLAATYTSWRKLSSSRVSLWPS